MNSQSKTNNLTNSSSQDGGCPDDVGADVAGTSPDVSEASMGKQGVRRSMRKRSAPCVYVAPEPKKITRNWSVSEKHILLRVLAQLNNRELLLAGSYFRFPFKIIRKRIGTKTQEEVQVFLTMLERRGAAAALLQMKKFPPIESWRQMADKLTILTSDDSSRHLIRVCNVMALESIESVDKKKNPRASRKKCAPSSTPPSTTAETMPVTEVPNLLTDEATNVPTPTATSGGLTDTSAVPSPVQNTEVVSGSVPSTAGVQNESGTAATPAAASAVKKEKADQHDMQFIPDYHSIYKYIAGLMQGEQKELGPLESMVIMDCLKSLEEHLRGRYNVDQKQFAQKRFLDILQNLYLSIDKGTGDPKGNEDEMDVDRQSNITTADLMGSESDHSQPNSHLEASHSAGRPLADRQRGVTVDSAKEQNLHMPHSREDEPTDSKAGSKKFKVIGLGSLNPFSIPVRLLEIRKDK